MEDLNDIKERKYSVLDNSYKTAEKLKGDEFEFGVIKVDDVGADIYMKDSCNYDAILFNRMVEYAHDLIESDDNIQSMLRSYETKEIKRVSQEDVNTLFEFFYDGFNSSYDFKNFLNISYMVEIISKETDATYDFIFSSLSYDNKVIVIDSLANETDLTF